MGETFCGFCNRIFKDGNLKCDCGRDTAPMTDAHREPGVLLLSGTGAARIWSAEVPFTADDFEREQERFRQSLERHQPPKNSGKECNGG